MAELTPGGVRRELNATKAAAVLGWLRPRDDPGHVRRQLAMDHLGDVRTLDRRIKAVGSQITDVATTGTTLVGIFGAGPVIAARILAEVGDPARFPRQRPVRRLQRHRGMSNHVDHCAWHSCHGGALVLQDLLCYQRLQLAWVGRAR